MSELDFTRWAAIVCGPFRIADANTLKRLWEAGWLPQRAIEHLEAVKGFRRTKKQENWLQGALGAPVRPLLRRSRTISELQFRCMLADAMLEVIRYCRKERRMEPDLLAFSRKLERQCRDQLAVREAKREEKRAKKNGEGA